MSNGSNGSNTVFILSYKKNGLWNELSNVSKARFKKKGFLPRVVEGYNLSDPKKNDPDMKKTHLVYRNFLDKILPSVERYRKKHKLVDGFFFAEDDAYLDERVDFDFLMKRLKTVDYKNKILRVGYQKVLGKNRPEYFVVGNQLIWVPLSKISGLKESLEKSVPQHLNGFFSKRENTLGIEVLDHDIQKREGKYVHEIEHQSITRGNIRKGLKLTKKKSIDGRRISSINL